MISDFPFIFRFWLTLFSLGFLFFPLTSRLLPNFIDRGYPFAKVIGILILSYAFFLLGHTKLLGLTFSNLIILLTVLVLSQLILMRITSRFVVFNSTDSNQQNSRNPHLNKFLPLEFLVSKWPLFLFEEILFFVCLTIWSYIRGFAPEIRGLEKFMDFGFVNSILTSQTLPPLDMWLTYAPDFEGHFINYYYFGHLYSAVLTRLSSLDSAITYNLLLASLFAFTVTGAFSIGANLLYYYFKTSSPPSPRERGNSASLLLTGEGQSEVKLKRLILAGIVTAFLVALAGNLHPIYIFTKGYPNENPVPFWQIFDGYNPNSYWYPNATRFIKNTIHEFPIYSFVVSDLHGHVLDIPFVLLTLALLLHLISQTATAPQQVQNSKFKIFNFKFLTLNFKPIFLGLLLAVMYMTNAWDGIIYLGLVGLGLFYLHIRKKSIVAALKETFIQGAVLTVSFFLFSLPFSANFKPFIHGIGVVCPPAFLSGRTIGPFLFEDAASHCDRSPIWMLAVLWGFFAYTALGFLLLVLLPRVRFQLNRPWHFSIFGLELSLAPHSQQPKPAQGGKSFWENLPVTDVFILLSIFLSFFLLIFPEFFYAKDIYPAHYRANTMFKLGYQAFMMMQIASAYIFFRILFNKRVTKQVPTFPSEITPRASMIRLFSLLWLVGFFFGFYLVGIYPYFAVNSYYGGLKVYKGLDGLAWMKDQYPDDYQAIVWLREQTANCHLPESHVKCQMSNVTLEAVGESYTDYARVSAYTGLPTVVGWPVHQWLWRGSYDEAGKRIPLVERMYTSTDINQVKDLLEKYNVNFVFVGILERQKYPKLTEDVFWNLGEVVFESGETRIYKISNFY